MEGRPGVGNPHRHSAAAFYGVGSTRESSAGQNAANATAAHLAIISTAACATVRLKGSSKVVRFSIMETGEIKAAQATDLKLIAYRVHTMPSMPIVPAPARRDWMDATHEKFAYRCLPLNIANQG